MEIGQTMVNLVFAMDIPMATLDYRLKRFGVLRRRNVRLRHLRSWRDFKAQPCSRKCWGMGFSLPVVEGEMDKHQQEHSVAIERMCLPQFAKGKAEVK